MISLPYFDALFRDFECEGSVCRAAFGRHVHWGFWPKPDLADGTMADFQAATERLTEFICDEAGVRDGMTILDAGCGFGGTVAHLNARLKNAEITGLNIDPRQLVLARKNVKAKSGNRVRFVEGDACDLPFEDASFDVVTAVECVFHFPSRQRFLSECRRVLKKGGKLVLSDFVPTRQTPFLLRGAQKALHGFIALSYGRGDNITLEEYDTQARQAGLRIRNAFNITAETLPTYPMLKAVLASSPKPPFGFNLATALLECTAKWDLVRYMVISFGS